MRSLLAATCTRQTSASSSGRTLRICTSLMGASERARAPGALDRPRDARRRALYCASMTTRSTSSAALTQVGLIGCGAIGRPVARALLTGRAGSHALAAVLARAPRELDGFPVIDSADAFLAGCHDLIIEAGGPAALPAPLPRARGGGGGSGGGPHPPARGGPSRGVRGGAP